MNMLTILFLASVTQGGFGSRNLPASYPWNMSESGYFQERIQSVDRVLHAKFVRRDQAEFQIVYNSPSLPRPTFWVDEFVPLSDDGKVLKGPPLRVVTARYVGSGVAPEPDETYLLLVTKPMRGETRMLVEHFPVGTLRIKTPASSLEVAGLACTPVKRILRARDLDGHEDLVGTLFLTLAAALGDQTNRLAINAIVERIQKMNFTSFLLDRNGTGGPEFDLAIAGQPSSEWMSTEMTPVVKSSLAKLKGDEMRAPLLGLLTWISGNESYAREMFELLKRLAAQKKWSWTASCNITSVPSKERMQAAHQFPGQPRERFFPFPDVAGIESKKRPPPPDDATIRMIISWLPSARPTFAIKLLRLLSSWADRSQMSPDLKLNPKVSTGPWKDGEPVVENLEFLIKLWRENPPPIRRS